MARVKLLNGEFDALNLQQTSDAIFSMLAQGQRGWLCTVNVAILMMMRSDRRLQKFVGQAAIVVADGQPLIWAAPLFKQNLPERVTGVDLVFKLCERAQTENLGIYLLGASQEIVSRLAQQLRQQYPQLRIDFSNGYFSAAQASERAAHIKQSGASILLVGMGVPRQEIFIEEQWQDLGVGIAIGVGGSFDVLAGLRKRAPAWIQSIGMEWSFRLIQEPRRLFMRYLVTNTQFIYLLFKAWLLQK
jgi:N-acetylglucosaminyldiphosphoundecaprenol N-acetyl-beta-D-mannosaminyltransferase